MDCHVGYWSGVRRHSDQRPLVFWSDRWSLLQKYQVFLKKIINDILTNEKQIKNTECEIQVLQVLQSWLFTFVHQLMWMIHHRMSKCRSPFQRELQKRSPLTLYMACTQNKWDFCKAAVWGKDVFHSILAAMERKETDAGETRLWLKACYNRYVI